MGTWDDRGTGDMRTQGTWGHGDRGDKDTGHGDRGHGGMGTGDRTQGTERHGDMGDKDMGLGGGGTGTRGHGGGTWGQDMGGTGASGTEGSGWHGGGTVTRVTTRVTPLPPSQATRWRSASSAGTRHKVGATRVTRGGGGVVTLGGGGGVTAPPAWHPPDGVTLSLTDFVAGVPKGNLTYGYVRLRGWGGDGGGHGGALGGGGGSLAFPGCCHSVPPPVPCVPRSPSSMAPT